MAARPLASQHVAGAEQHACARAAARCGSLGRIGGGCWEAGCPVRFGLGPVQPWFSTQSPYNERFKAFGSGS